MQQQHPLNRRFVRDCSYFGSRGAPRSLPPVCIKPLASSVGERPNSVGVARGLLGGAMTVGATWPKLDSGVWCYLKPERARTYRVCIYHLLILFESDQRNTVCNLSYFIKNYFEINQSLRMDRLHNCLFEQQHPTFSNKRLL